MDFRAPLIMFFVVMGRILSPIFSSIAPFLLNYDTFGGVFGVALVGMLPPCLSFGITWGVPPPRHHLFKMLGLMTALLFFGISSWRGINESFKMSGLVSCIFGGTFPTLFGKLFRKNVS